MRDARILRYVTETPWAITRAKLDQIEAMLGRHLRGEVLVEGALEAFIGGDPPPRPEASQQGAVAVLPLHGVIEHRIGSLTEMSGGISAERFGRLFRAALADDGVSAILIDVDSPGGTVAGVPELAAEIYAARGTKPIVAHVNALAASAAYWIASAADTIEATPSGLVGSIGVLTAHLDTTKADEADGVTRTVISAGKYKAEGYGPLSDDARAAVQARVNEAYAGMVADIGRGRGVAAEAVRNGFGEGRIVSAKEGLKLGMIDRLSTFEATLGRLLGRRGRAGMRAEASDGMTSTADLAQAVVADLEADRRRRLERL